MSIGSRLKNAWNVFTNKDTYQQVDPLYYSGSYYKPDRPFVRPGTERSIITAIYNRMAIDVASIEIHHVKLDSNGRFKSYVNSGLEKCLNLSANIDQDGRSLIQDAAMSLFDEGVIGIVPVEMDFDPKNTETFSIDSLRIGKVLEWFPDKVRIEVYNELSGKREELILPKRLVAIVENPLYAVMNEPNSTLKRLIHKLNILDAIDEQSGAGKLDLIIQLPYVVKSPTKRSQAEQRRKDIELQLAGSKYGIAYIDGTEHVTQLNRPAENNLMEQIKYLTSMLYGQLGITEEVINGTANEETMLNYHNRSIEPVISAISNSMKRTFLSKTAISQGQSIMFFKDPFKLVPVSQIADIGDKMTRNEILTSNEVRGIIGYKPVDDERADQLRNKNLNMTDGEVPITTRDDLFDREE